MAFEINDFTSAMSGHAHADKFDVVFGLPSGLQIAGVDAKYLSLQCEAAEFPGVDINPIEYRHHAFIRRVPGHVNYTPLTFTFYCNSQMLEKQFFEGWMNLCIPKQSGLVSYRLNNMGSPLYEATITVNQYSQSGAYTYFAQADEVWPISVGQLSTSWADDSIQRLTVTFAYTRWWTAADGAQGAPTGSPQNTGPQGIGLITNIGAEFAMLSNGIKTILSGKNPNQLLSGVSESVVGGGSILNQVNNFTNEYL